MTISNLRLVCWKLRDAAQHAHTEFNRLHISEKDSERLSAMAAVGQRFAYIDALRALVTAAFDTTAERDAFISQFHIEDIK